MNKDLTENMDWEGPEGPFERFVVGRKMSKKLNKDWTFETFVVGKENEVAVKLAKQIARCRSKDKAFYICGSESGLGVSHLLQSIAWQILRRHPSKEVIYKDIENYENQYYDSLSDQTSEEFLEYLGNNVFCLVLDGLSILTKKALRQKHVLYVIEKRLRHGLLTLIGGCYTPETIERLDKNLLNIIKGFPVAEIHPPGFDLRLAILWKLQERYGINFNDNILTLLAREIKDIRLLQSAMFRLKLALDVYPDIPSDKMARDILTEKCYK